MIIPKNMNFSLRTIIILVLFFVLLQLKAQEKFLCDDIKPFGKHLFETQNYQELISLNRKCAFEQKDKATYDTLQYLLGRSHLKLDNIDSAYHKFRDIKQKTRLHNHGIRLSFNRYLDKKNYSQPLKYLETGEVEVHRNPDIAFYRSGLYLLDKDLVQFDSLINETQIIRQNDKDLLRKYRNRYEATNMKSPWLAGLISAAVPGLGKVYAGKPNQGLSLFLSVGIFALQSWEAYYRQGTGSPVFYVNGALAAGYYITNIWGSVMSVKTKNQEELNEIDQSLRNELYFSL